MKNLKSHLTKPSAFIFFLVSSKVSALILKFANVVTELTIVALIQVWQINVVFKFNMGKEIISYPNFLL